MLLDLADGGTGDVGGVRVALASTSSVGTREVGVSDLGLAALMGGDHDPAVLQATCVVRHIRARPV